MESYCRRKAKRDAMFLALKVEAKGFQNQENVRKWIISLARNAASPTSDFSPVRPISDF